MEEPVILRFPAPLGMQPPASRQAVAAPSAHDLDLETILAAWNDATERLERTHQALQEEVRRLSDELEAKNRELARKNRLADLGQMASHVAHEVRNSLVPMKLYLSLLRRRLGGDDGSLDVLDKVTTGFTALEVTVGDLLHFSSQRDARCAVVAIHCLLAEVCQSLAPQLAAQEIDATVDCQSQLTASIDADMLRRGVLNLVLNALDVLPLGGQIVLTACLTRYGLEIEVADSGPGVPESLAERLFEPFFTTKSSGTGLGLAIVERIASAHGGRAVVRNCPEGGAAFTLILPQPACTNALSYSMEKAA
jgi:signal transduction histidine kinase